MKLIVAGSRSISDFRTVESAILQFTAGGSVKGIEIVSGGARGVDACAERFAVERSLEYTEFEPDWDDLDHPNAVVKEGEYGEYNAAAGPIRNGEMAEYGDALVAIWDGESAGTRSMIEEALERGLDVYVKQME